MHESAAVFDRFDQQVVASHPHEVVDAIRAVERATDQGQWAFGFVSYDAAAGLDPVLPTAGLDQTQASGSSLPLVWFGLSNAPMRPTPLVAPTARCHIGPWRDHLDRSGYSDAVKAVRDAIAAGDTYQCNLTTACTASFTGEPLSLYAGVAHAQKSEYSAYLDLGGDVVASASPELFFQWSDNHILTRPMKGTALRGHNSREDERVVRGLLSDAKERAENIIVVDLLRNDISKIAKTGSVHVPALLRAEKYPTVWQLTSDVAATLHDEVGLLEILKALFPSGSITGAPKLQTMRLIRRIERRHRGIYCGTIGLVAPKDSSIRARFSVAIRTVHIDRRRSICEYGVGSGITWSSEAGAEYEELRAKREILRRDKGPDHHPCASDASSIERHHTQLAGPYDTTVGLRPLLLHRCQDGRAAVAGRRACNHGEDEAHSA